ncbi:MAG: sodium/solute symporter [Planctomycetota bacterium]|nr:sodium/solute symporter [Planctomycetota bacterium]MDA1248774.1 sodium/solute symporter [Planctomycetota bacterium]
MGEIFTTLDYVLFFAALIGVMVIGLIAGRKEESSEDYFLAGRSIPWWAVAGSIYGSNVSANHMVGMMGVGFSIGFFQSHFEIGAILGLMVLCYGFLPVYRKLGVYTLSEYLGRRYDDRSRVSYAIIMVIIMAVVQMVPGLYIGARTICVLLGGDAIEEVVDAASPAADGAAAGNGAAAENVEGAEAAPAVKEKKEKVKFSYYALFVILLALISAAYTIFGGLKAVIWTDFLQSMLLLVAGIAVAWLAFSKLGDVGVGDAELDANSDRNGWTRMMEFDQAEERSQQRMHIYQPTNHPQLPWTGVLTGLFAMHCFYWGTNQFIVQRALGARSDTDAKLGIIAAGFLKLLIPFFAIAPGVAAFYLFREKMPERTIAPDAVFPELVKYVIPAGYGLIGIIGAGLIGAILSSIDSMMNSAATIVTMDIYKKYMNPDATDAQLIRAGRISIIGFVLLATFLALFIMDPNSEKNFFLQIADYQNYLTPGILVAFFMGMFWPRGNGNGAFCAILSGIFFSWLAETLYNSNIESWPAALEMFGAKLNFFHRVVFVLPLSAALHVVVSLMTEPDEEKGRLNWTDLGGHKTEDLKKLVARIGVTLATFVILAVLMVYEKITPGAAACLGALATFLAFQRHIHQTRRFDVDESGVESRVPLPRDDRFWASFLCSAAVFMHYYYY